jgi:peptide/nickel transport system ATP-binding protein
MRAGQVVETGLVRDVLVRPRHDYTRILLAAVPTLRTDRNHPLAMIGTERAIILR